MKISNIKCQISKIERENRKSLKHFWILICIFNFCILIFNFLGCSSIPTRRVTEKGEVITVEKPLGVASTLRFEDIPVPNGFNIVRGQSFIYQDASVRVGLLKYSGWAKASQVISFFKSQMPLYNWNLINVVEFGNITMNFVKADESCVITVEPLTTKSLINIVISPKSGTLTTGFGASNKLSPSAKKERF